MVPSFHRDLVRGVATYSLELFRAHADLDVLYVPIGLGSGICGAIAARDALGLKTEIVGVAGRGRAGLRAVVRRRPPDRDQHRRYARRRHGDARARSGGARNHHARRLPRDRRVSDDEIGEAVRAYWTDTHNLSRRRRRGPRSPRR